MKISEIFGDQYELSDSEEQVAKNYVRGAVSLQHLHEALRLQGIDASDDEVIGAGVCVLLRQKFNPKSHLKEVDKYNRLEQMLIRTQIYFIEHKVYEDWFEHGLNNI